MLFLVFMVAVFNLCLGFALATYLARRRSIGGAVAAWSAPDAAAETSDLGRSAAAAEEEAAVGEDASEVDKAEGVAQTAPPIEETPTAAAANKVAWQAGEEGETPPPETSQATVTAIQDEVKRYDEQLTQLSDKIRDPGPEADEEWVQEQAQSLLAVNEEYLDSRNAAHDDFESLHRAVETHASACDVIEEAMVLQTTKIHEANDAIEGGDFEGDAKEASKRLVAETSKLTDVNDQVRDALDAALVDIARQDSWLQEAPSAMRTDLLTGLTSRAGLEAEVANWHLEDPQGLEQLSIGLLDVDGFGKLNEQYGRAVGDQVLRALAQQLSNESGDKGPVARYAGQRFAMVFHGTDINGATNAMEEIRQIVQKSRLHHEEKEIRITLSCGVTEAVPEDTFESLLDRAEAAVREAKRNGRNRTFVHDRKTTSPVAPPTFTLDGRHISLETMQPCEAASTMQPQ